MSSVQESFASVFPDGPVSNGVLAGVVGGVVLAGLLQFVGFAADAPKLFGLGESLVLGWVIMLASGGVGGAAFAGLLELDAVGRLVTGFPALLALGCGVGLVLWLVFPVVVLPLWVSTMTYGTLPLPNLHLPSLGGFVVYGAITSAIYASLRT